MFNLSRKLLLYFNYRHFIRQIHGKATVFSGIQPTGVPHLGNYFGAIKQWSMLQKEGKRCVFSIVDLHSITLPQDPKVLSRNIHLMAACLLACGIDPDSSVFFLQSQVSHHTELAWILGCITTMARLSQLPQYKEKSSGSLENIPLGLYLYPVLQTADILLYRATEVPVGDDQVQHIQLACHLAKLFNNKYGKVFPLPTALTADNCARIKSLRHPDKKMSKSDTLLKSRIHITDSPDIITKRIKEAVTDLTSAVTYDPDKRPGVSNLILMHSLCTGVGFQKICDENRHLDTGQYKLVVAEAVVEYLKPIRLKFEELKTEQGFITEVLGKGRTKAMEMSSTTMDKVKSVVGLHI